MTLYPNEGHCSITFRPSSTPQEEDTTTIKVRTYKSDLVGMYANERRFAVEFTPLDESGHMHGISINFAGSAAELESLFSRAIQGIREITAVVGESPDYKEMTFDAPLVKAKKEKKEKSLA